MSANLTSTHCGSNGPSRVTTSLPSAPDQAVTTMAFLFKSKKNAQPPPAANSSLPPASRNIHTSDGSTPSSSTQNGSIDKSTDGRSTTSPPPLANTNNPNGSMSSMGSQLANAPGPGFVRRERSESEAGVSSTPYPQCKPARLINSTEPSQQPGCSCNSSA